VDGECKMVCAAWNVHRSGTHFSVVAQGSAGALDPDVKFSLEGLKQAQWWTALMLWLVSSEQQDVYPTGLRKYVHCTAHVEPFTMLRR
jgi:hypothetical protein